MKKNIVDFQKSKAIVTNKNSDTAMKPAGYKAYKTTVEPVVETVQERCQKNGERILSYRNQPIRWKALMNRPQYAMNDAEDKTSAICYAIGGFKAAVKSLCSEGILSSDDFPRTYNGMEKSAYYLPKRALNALSVIPDKTRAYIALNMCRNIHDGWVYDHAEDFFHYFIDWEYVYLPLEMIGVDQLSAIYIPLEVALQRFGLGDVTWEMIVQEYDEERLKYVMDHKLYSLKRLTDWIVEIGNTYTALRADVKKAIVCRKLAFDMARQVIHYSGEIFAKGTV